ncbi:MAG: RNA methyltransferase [Oscillospiraceae bacterium]
MGEITSRENTNIKLYQKLLSSKKYRKEYGLFVLEGLRICLDALKENAELYCVLATKTALAKYSEALDLLKKSFPEKFFEITDELGDRLSDTVGTQGVFAICKTLDKSDFNDKISSGGKFIVLNNVQDPGNVGTIIRTADAVGISGIIMCNSCDIYNPKVTRSTMGSIFRVPIFENYEIIDVLEIFKQNKIPTFAAVIDADAASLIDCNFGENSAVIIGNEGNGLPEEIVQNCDKKLTIKMRGNVNSLNAAMATGIIMWEMLR